MAKAAIKPKRAHMEGMLADANAAKRAIGGAVRRGTQFLVCASRTSSVGNVSY